MTRIKAWIRLLLGFSQTETNAFIILLPLMLVIIIAEPIYQTYFMYGKPDNVSDRRVLDSLVAAWDWSVDSTKLRRQYSLSNNDSSFRKKSFVRKEPFRKEGKFPVRQPKVPGPKFDLNLADSTQLKSIYGIGPVIAKRIITYRTNLGGFLEFGQLYEVWGLDSSVVVRLSEKSVIAPGFMPNRLAINQSSEEELARHPYLRNKLARAVVNYRFQHGNFASVDDLRKITIVDEKAFLRIKPYLTLE